MPAPAAPGQHPTPIELGCNRPEARRPTRSDVLQHWREAPCVLVTVARGYPQNAKPDTSKPYVMYANTPYAHLMLPVD